MKICLPKLKGGKGAFYDRLVARLRTRGVKVTRTDPGSCDIIVIASNFGILRQLDKRTKVILRLDGLAMDAHDKYIKLLSQRVDGVIYQAQFCKFLFDKFVRVFKQPHRIICNGADPNYYRDIIPIAKESQYNFISFANWKKSHRLGDIINSFLLADLHDSALWIAGNTLHASVSSKKLKSYAKDPRIKLLGQLPHAKLARYLKMCDGSIHLRWCDSCPNSVVETINCGVPVITNNASGTAELARGSGGIICEVDPPIKSFPHKNMKPPSIDKTVVAEAIHELITSPREVFNGYVDINKVSKDYLSFIKRIVKGKR